MLIYLWIFKFIYMYNMKIHILIHSLLNSSRIVLSNMSYRICFTINRLWQSQSKMKQDTDVLFHLRRKSENYKWEHCTWSLIVSWNLRSSIHDKKLGQLIVVLDLFVLVDINWSLAINKLIVYNWSQFFSFNYSHVKILYFS